MMDGVLHYVFPVLRASETVSQNKAFLLVTPLQVSVQGHTLLARTPKPKVFHRPGKD